MNLKFGLVFVVLLNCGLSEQSSKYLRNITGCGPKDLKKEDKNVFKLVVYGAKGRKFPESQGQVPGYCSESNQAIADWSAFMVRCYEPELSNLAKIFIHSVKTVNRQLCKKGSKKMAKIVEVASCVNVELRDNKCFDTLTEQVAKLQFIGEDRIKMPHACCLFATAMDCFEKKLNKIPCARKHSSAVMDFIRSLYSNSLDVYCGEYNESTDRCEKLGPIPALVKLPKSAKPKRYTNFIPAAIEMIESMESFQIP